MSALFPHSSEAASPLSAERSGPLRGRFRPPGDKSISHRAFLFGLLSRGLTEIEGLLEGDDVLRTGRACAGARGRGQTHRRRADGMFAGRGSARSPRRSKRSISATPAPVRG